MPSNPTPTPPDRDVARDRGVNARTALAAAGTALGLLGFEAGTAFALPELRPWQSHAVTIAAGAVVAALVARRALRARAALHARVLDETARRTGAEMREVVLRESEARFRQLVEQSPEAIAVHDAAAVLYANPACLRLLGAPSLEALSGRALIDYVDQGDRQRVADRLATLRHAPSGLAPADPAEYRLLTLDGGARVVEARSVAVARGGRDVVQTVLRDVTEQKRLEEALTHQAFHDPLTGLANRALMRDRTAHALARAHRDATETAGVPAGRVAVLVLDLDHFEHVNSAFGHAAGDALLAAVAKRLLAATRGCDTVARLGGDEFAVLLESMSDPDDALRVADRVVAAMRHPFVVEGRHVVVGVSIGVAGAADLPPDDEGVDAADVLLRNADLALYAAKGEGRFRSVTYAPPVHDGALARLELEGALRAGVAALAGDARGGVPNGAPPGGFSLAYQPIVDLATGRTTGLEALLRWTVPGRGRVPPAEFIPAAEEAGLIGALGRWVLREATRQTAEWEREFPQAPVTVSVNVSGRQLEDPAFALDVAEAVEASGLAPRRLVLEFAEGVLTHDAAGTLARLRALKALGVRLAVDDFGTGYSSPALLRQLPVDVLKIDKSCVDGVGRGGDEGVVAAAVATFGASMSLTTVAEGVEDEAQLARLRELGCARGQGYLFARPLTPADVARRLAAGATLPAP